MLKALTLPVSVLIYATPQSALITPCDEVCLPCTCNTYILTYYFFRMRIEAVAFFDEDVSDKNHLTFGQSPLAC